MKRNEYSKGTLVNYKDQIDKLYKQLNKKFIKKGKKPHPLKHTKYYEQYSTLYNLIKNETNYE